METLDDAMAKICELRGSLLAFECFVSAIVLTMPAEHRSRAQAKLQDEAEACRTALLGALISEHTLTKFERDVQRASDTLS